MTSEDAEHRRIHITARFVDALQILGALRPLLKQLRFFCVRKGVGQGYVNGVYFWLFQCLYSEELSVSRCAPELRRNNIAIFGRAVAYIINILLPLWPADHKAFLPA